MINRERIGLNRIVYPGLNLEGFFQLTSELKLNKIELRNDLTGKGIIDSYSPQQVRDLAEALSIQILSINALQKFNVAEILPELMEELKELITLAKSINCRAIVLCPNNDVQDQRDEDRIYRETVQALKAFGPLFENSGVLGYVEPLGFPESSLNSLIKAKELIEESGYSTYKTVHDTFHHFLGPDTLTTLEREYDIACSGLVHISGVEEVLPAEQYRDEHRILPSPNDRLKSRQQLDLIVSLGYRGNVCFESFASEIHRLDLDEIKLALEESIDYICTA